MFAKRIRILGLICFSSLLVLWARVVHLQLGLGPWQRAVASTAKVRSRLIPAVRGTIRAADGTVLACDRCDAELAVHYRYLERPLDEAWLTQQARARLSTAERRNPRRVAEVKNRLRREIEAMWQGLAELTGTDVAELDRRAQLIQRRVGRIVESVNRRRREQWASPVQRTGSATEDIRPGLSSGSDILRQLARWLGDTPPPPSPMPDQVDVIEQYRFYPLVENISLQTILDFTDHPEWYPGVRIQQRIGRVYPQGKLASAVVGYIEPPRRFTQPSGDVVAASHSGVGRAGIEGFYQYEFQLQGEPGRVRELVQTRSGPPRILGGRPPQPGKDLTLTLDLQLQRYAEELLQERRKLEGHINQSFNSGAMLVLDVRTGAVLTAAVVPGFDLNVAARPGSQAAQELLQQPDAPLYNRIVQMSLPPGSIFKPITAIASLKSGLDPRQPFVCRGYLHSPDRHRCMIFRHHGVGHGSVDLTGALARSCNVYFFRLAKRLDWAEIHRWARAFGFGRRTRVDLAAESTGFLPPADDPQHTGAEPRRPPDTLGMAIGQGALSTTPIQIGVMMAAIANGGLRVVPHFRRDAFQPPVPIAGVTAKELAVVRQALEQCISDRHGTGHQAVYLSEIVIAGKTGTAQSGSDRGDHGWFAGYVPAQEPKVVVVIALEHCELGARTAGRLAQALIRKMLELGYFGPERSGEGARASAVSSAERGEVETGRRGDGAT